MKKKIIFGAIGLVAAAVGLLTVTRTLYPTNVAETAPDQAEEKLRTRTYKTDLQTFAAEAARIVPTLSTYGGSWKYTATEQDENSVVIKAEVPVVVFTDDLQIKAEKAADGIRVNVRSSSRVGKSDLGENRRHVLKILEALDARFAN